MFRQRNVSPVRAALNRVRNQRRAQANGFLVTRNAFADDQPDTYRFHRLTDNGVVKLVTANPRTGSVTELKAGDEQDIALIQEVLEVLGIPGTVRMQGEKPEYRT